MRRESIKGGIVEYYDNELVEKVVCTVDGICKVYYHDKPHRELNVGCSSYNCQYGIPVSNDGTKLFVGAWEKGLGGFKKGLQAYDIESGSLLWRLNEGKIRHIFVYQNYLIVLKAYEAIFKLDVETGEVLDKIKSGTISFIYNLEYPYIFVETLSGKYVVIDTEKMLVVKKYSNKVVNPSDCVSLIILDAVLADNKLTISGFEQYPNNIYIPSKSITVGEKYKRVIDSDFSTF